MRPRGRVPPPSGAVLVLVLLSLATTHPAGAADLKSFVAKEWGVALTYPADLVASPRFKSNYFDRGAWRVSYAADTGPGSTIVALSLPDITVTDAGGDSVATAELRLGASRDPDVVASCLTYGMNSGNNAETGMRRIGGVDFAEVPDNSDAEMMKTIATDDYRAVHDGACYAIDVVTYVGGTSNRRPAFAPARLAHLTSVLDTIRFDAR